MTGTSLDGVDAALLEIGGDSVESIDWRLVASVTTPFAETQRESIHREMVAGSAASLCALHGTMGEWLASAVEAVCERAGISPRDLDLIGSHGQTIWHQPPRDGRRGTTLQIGCPATIAERTGTPVV